MKAMAIEAFGGSDQLRLMDLPIPEPEDDEIRIEVAAAGVNPVDWKIREGMLKEAFPHGFPLIPGWDAAGTVHALGKAATRFKVGDQVHAYCRKPVIQWGTYAEYVTVREAVTAPMPRNLSFAQAATIPLAGLTAWQALIDFALLAPGQTVLVHAGAGGVGGLAIQFAKHRGAKVYTTARESNHDYVKGLGADAAIDYTRQNFVDRVRALEPSGVDVVFDTVGGNTLTESYRVVRPDGVLISIVDVPDQRTAELYNLRTGYVFVEPNGDELREIGRLIEAGTVRAPAIEEMPLEAAAAAQDKNEARHVRGKIVLKVK